MNNIHLTREGRGLPIVLFHGWGFDSRIWYPVLSKLVLSYEVYCVDLPGFGLTSLMSWDAFKSSLLQKLPSCFAVAGWSLGGMVAMRLAMEEGKRVTHLISIASTPRFVKDENWPGVASAVLCAFYDRLQREPELVLQEFLDLQIPAQQEPLYASPTLSGLKMGLDWLINWDFREKLLTISIPMLSIFGRLDAIIPRKTMEVMQIQYPHFEYIMINKAAHALFLSHQEEFVQAVMCFYSKKTIPSVI